MANIIRLFIPSQGIYRGHSTLVTMLYFESIGNRFSYWLSENAELHIWEELIMIKRLAFIILAIMILACASIAAQPDPEVQKVLAPSGKLRIGVFQGSPTSMIKDKASGELMGVAVELGTEMAKRLGVPFELVEYKRVEEVLEALKSGQVDFTVTNATAVRAKIVDFTQPVLGMELGYLVPPASRISSLSDLDHTGVRVGVIQGSTSQRTLPELLKNASVVPAPSIKAAPEMLLTGRLDAFATNKPTLFEMSDGMPGSRVLDGRWGLEYMAIAIPKGREQGMAFARKFAADAMSEDLVALAVKRLGLRGIIRVESK